MISPLGFLQHLGVNAPDARYPVFFGTAMQGRDLGRRKDRRPHEQNDFHFFGAARRPSRKAAQHRNMFEKTGSGALLVFILVEQSAQNYRLAIADSDFGPRFSSTRDRHRTNVGYVRTASGPFTRRVNVHQ